METSFLLGLHAALSSPALDAVFKGVTLLGENKLLAPLCAAGAVFLWLRRQKTYAAALFGLYIVEAGLTELLKVAVRRARPELWPRVIVVHGASFPSGHAAGTASCLTFIAWLLARSYPKARAGVWGAWLLVLLGVGLSRLYFGVHWPSDVLGGWALGGVLAAFAIRAVRRVPDRPRVAGLDT